MLRRSPRVTLKSRQDLSGPDDSSSQWGPLKSILGSAQSILLCSARFYAANGRRRQVPEEPLLSQARRK